MIEPKELRIGNWISQMNFSMETEKETKEYFQVEKIIPDKIVFSHYDPIPLKREWTLKLGFDIITPSHYRLTIDKNHFFEIKFYVESVYDPPREMVQVFYYDHGFPAIEKFNISVHQLQNLYFALTGEELNAR